MGDGNLRWGSRRTVRVAVAGGVVLGGLCLAVVLTWCSGGGQAEREREDHRERGRVLLIGIDGATLRIAQPLIASGRLPSLEGLSKEGVHGPLRSAKPFYSPRLWTTIATGKHPQKHGIEGFVTEDPPGVFRIYRSSDRRVPALWNIASRAGLSVAVVNWWSTFPPESVNGVMVSDHFIPGEDEAKQFAGELHARGRWGRGLSAAESEEGPPTVFPRELVEELQGLVKTPDPLTDFADPFAENDSLPSWVVKAPLSRAFRADELAIRIALHVEAKLSPHLMMVFLSGIDRTSHQLFGYVEGVGRFPEDRTPTQEERAEGARQLFRYYEYTDALIGRLVDRYGPNDLVMVVSDHGFEGGIQRFGALMNTGIHDGEDAEDGVVFARGAGIPAGSVATGLNVVDVTPTVLAWAGLAVGADMDGRVAGFLEGATPALVASYDDIPVERIGIEKSGAEGLIVEQLKQLGYIE